MIQVRIAPVVVKTPCDVLTVARSWDDVPVQATFICGMSRRSQVCGMSFVSGSSSCGMSAASRACGMTSCVASVCDVSRVQHEVPEGCHERIQIGG